jgi:methylenetetrahydrofolate dehydrogenase (NADP+) / methenyltetrahydrofolate cyclohydrolase
MQLLDGKSSSEMILKGIKEEIENIIMDRGVRKPRIDMILVGDDYASKQYVNMKKKKARETGIDGQVHELPGGVSQADLLELVDELNSYPDIDGFMVQLPLPAHLDTQEILDSISTEKDVDGLGAENLGGLLQGADWAIASATARGVVLLLDEYDIEVAKKDVVIIGRSKSVGLPLYSLLLNEDANVTLLHSKSGRGKLAEHCERADVLISAAGQKGLVTADMVKDGAIVVDIGTNRDKDGKLCGDVDFESVKDKASYISPVPGGAGPMTIAALLLNVFESWKWKIENGEQEK